MRGVVLALVSCFGCGRFGFDVLDDARLAGPPTVDAPTVLGDAPPVPAQICRVVQIRAMPPASADLAIAATSQGYAAIWVDTQEAHNAYGVLLGADHHLLAERSLDYLTDTRLSGLLEVGSRLLIASATDRVETLRSVSPDLGALPGTATRADVEPSRDPFAMNAANTTRAWVSGSGADTLMAYVDDEAALGETRTLLVYQPKLELACATGPGHGHCAWAQEGDSGKPAPSCVIADIELDQALPRFGTSHPFADDCRAPRIATGPRAMAEIGVWTTTTGVVRAEFPLKDPKLAPFAPVDIATSGSTPKVQFDGVRFWIASLDAAGTLQLTSFDQDASHETTSMSGWVPHGPEAFELVRRPVTPGADNAEIVLAVLRNTELDLLTICPP